MLIYKTRNSIENRTESIYYTTSMAVYSIQCSTVTIDYGIKF